MHLGVCFLHLHCLDWVEWSKKEKNVFGQKVCFLVIVITVLKCIYFLGLDFYFLCTPNFNTRSISTNLCYLITSLLQEGVKTENNEHINLKVAGQDGSVVQFKIKRHTPLIKLMKAYCERQVGEAQYQCAKQSLLTDCEHWGRCLFQDEGYLVFLWWPVKQWFPGRNGRKGDSVTSHTECTHFK